MTRWGVACATLLLCSQAAAHLASSETRSTRYVEVTAQARRVRILYLMRFGEKPANIVRRGIDLDHDGELNPQEILRWRELQQKTLSERFDIVLDGRPLQAAFQGRMMMSDTRLGEIAFAAHFEATFPVGSPGAHQLEISDRIEVPRAGEHEVAFLVGLGARFRDSRRGSGPVSEKRSIVFQGPRRTELEERKVTFRFETYAAPALAATARSRRAEAPSRGGASTGLVVGAALIGAAGLFALTRWARRARKRDGG